MNKRKNFVWISVLLVTLSVISSLGTYAFAAELVIQKPEFSLGSNHQGSMIRTQTVSGDDSTWIFVTYTEPVEKEHMTINLKFTDKNGKLLYDVNYDILATQNGQVVLDKKMVNHKIGIRDHLTQALPSNDNLTIKITLQGIGTKSPFTGSQGEFIEVNVVPEFGAITPIILGISILSIIIIGAKNKIPFKPITPN